MSKTTTQPKKLRIFFNSNAIWAASGYSNQIAELLPLIRDEGYPLAITNFFGLEGGKIMLDGILQYPKINHVYGSDALIHHAKDFQADIAFTLQDIWVLNPQDLEQVKNFIPIVPIDHDPVPSIILDRLKYAYRIITYSKFGQKALQNKGIHSTYIPHTVNTEIFKPMDKKLRKVAGGLPADAFVVGMVAANKDNPPRKSFQEAMDAFKLFLEKVPNAYMYIHTNPEFPGGFPLREYAAYIGIQERVLFPDTYQINFNIGKAEMALVYNTFDMLLMPSVSEGFGVPAIEAQACGVPVIVNNWTSMPELIIPNKTGAVCELIKGPSGKRFSHLQSYIGIPDTLSLFEKMMYIHDSNRSEMGRNARNWVVENYDTATIFKERWIPFLQKLELEIYGKEVV